MTTVFVMYSSDVLSSLVHHLAFREMCLSSHDGLVKEVTDLLHRTDWPIYSICVKAHCEPSLTDEKA